MRASNLLWKWIPASGTSAHSFLRTGQVSRSQRLVAAVAILCVTGNQHARPRDRHVPMAGGPRSTYGMTLAPATGDAYSMS